MDSQGDQIFVKEIHGVVEQQNVSAQLQVVFPRGREQAQMSQRCQAVVITCMMECIQYSIR